MAVCTICRGAPSETWMSTYYVPGIVLGTGVLPSIRPHLIIETGTLSHPTKQAHWPSLSAEREGREAASRALLQDPTLAWV